MIILDEQDREIMAKALVVTHTRCLEALLRCVEHHDRPGITRQLELRTRLLRLLDALGHPADDEYRMSKLRELAEEHHVTLA